MKHQDKPGMVGHFQTNQLGYTFNSASFQIIQNIIYKGEGGGGSSKAAAQSKSTVTILQWLSRFAKTTCFVTILTP